MVRNEAERHDVKTRCNRLQTDNDTLEGEKERLQQELSASQHELHILHESLHQYRGGEQNLTSADANSYESLPTTDIDRDEPTPSKVNRLSYSGESSSTTDSEDNPGGELEDTGYASHGSALGAASASMSAVDLSSERPKVEKPVQITTSVVTEIQPAQEHTAVELANDQLACLHAATAVTLDHKILQAGRVSDEAIKYAEEEDDDLAPLGAPPPIPVEERVNSRTPSDVEYRDSDMDDALASIEPSTTTTHETTQEQQHSRTDSSHDNSTVPKQRHSSGDGAPVVDDNASALKKTDVEEIVEEKPCHIEVIGDEQSNDVSSERTTVNSETPVIDNSLISNTTDMQNQSVLTTSESTEDQTTTTQAGR